LITFVTLWGEKVVVRSTYDQNDFEKAITKDPKTATFRVGNKVYFTRSIASWTPRTRRGPIVRRIRMTGIEGV